MEKHVGHVVFFAALEDGLFAILLIERAVFRAHACVGRVEQHIALLNEIRNRAGNRDVERVEFRAMILHREIEGIGHPLLLERADGEGGSHVRHADEFHITL